MRAGSLDRTITVQRQTEAVAPSGAVAVTWTNLMTVRAEVRQQTVDEIATGFGEAQQETLIFITRWNPAPVVTGDRIIFDGRAYDIKQMVEVGRRKGWKLRGVAV